MALIVEDGTIVAGAESYVSVAAASTYFTNQSNAAWAALSQAQQEAALRQATKYLDGFYFHKWKGLQVNYLSQSLQWPRMNVNILGSDIDIHRSYGFAGMLPYNVIPQGLKDACCEAAIRASQGLLAADLQNGVKSKNIAGAITTTYSGDSGGATMRYQVIDMLLSAFLKGSSDSIRG